MHALLLRISAFDPDRVAGITLAAGVRDAPIALNTRTRQSGSQLATQVPADIERAHQLGIPELIQGKYRILRFLGSGAFADVFLAQHARITTRFFAIKVLRQEHAHNSIWVERFLREAQTTAALSCRYTVDVTDFGETEGGLPYIVMDFVAGPDLADTLSLVGPLKAGTVARFSLNILAALEEAHGAGIVHRDLKPSNVFLASAPGEQHLIARVGDFGIAKIVDPESSVPQGTEHTQVGTVLCTPSYASPELLKGKVTPQCDIYALGHVMIEMFDGVPVYDDDHPARITVMHLDDEPVPLSQAVSQSGLGEVIARAVEKDPEKRFQTATEMRAALEEAWRTQPEHFVVANPLSVEFDAENSTYTIAARESVHGDSSAELLMDHPATGTRPFGHTPAAVRAPETQATKQASESTLTYAPVDRRKQAAVVVVAALALAALAIFIFQAISGGSDDDASALATAPEEPTINLDVAIPAANAQLASVVTVGLQAADSAADRAVAASRLAAAEAGVLVRQLGGRVRAFATETQRSRRRSARSNRRSGGSSDSAGSSSSSTSSDTSSNTRSGNPLLDR